MKRFNHDADSYEEAINYIKNRSIQLLKYGVRLCTTCEIGFGIESIFEYKGNLYKSLYLYKPNRNKGIYKKWFKSSDYPVITHIECNLVEYLNANDIPNICLGEFEQTMEYKLIELHYGDQKANRSGVYLMNHIDEGLSILSSIGASETSMKSYCMHPLVQSDQDLYKNIDKLLLVNSIVASTTIEYRSVANEYLSNREISGINEIRLSPLKDVNDMLVADKIQNYKDFEIYHKRTHERSKILDEYFNNWLKRLEVSISDYKGFFNKLTVDVPEIQTNSM